MRARTTACLRVTVHACVCVIGGRCWAHRLGLAGCVIPVLLRTAWICNHPHSYPSISRNWGMVISLTFPTSYPSLAFLTRSILHSPPPLCNILSSLCPSLPFPAVSSQIWRNVTVKKAEKKKEREREKKNGGCGGRKRF